MRQITELQHTKILTILQAQKIGDAEALKLYLELIAMPAQPEQTAKASSPKTTEAAK